MSKDNPKINTPFGTLSWLIPGEIIIEKYLNGGNIHDAKEHIRLVTEYFASDGKPILSLSDLRNYKGKSPDKEARDYFASNEAASLTAAAAILVGNPISKILGNLYIKFSKPPFPTKLFSNEEKAIAWLKTHIK